MDWNEYQKEVNDFAKDIFDEIKEEATENEKFNAWDYDDRIHETIDGSSFAIYMNLQDAAFVVENADNVETDSGLWEGQEPIDAIKTQAFFTMRWEVTEKLDELLKELENEIENGN